MRTDGFDAILYTITEFTNREFYFRWRHEKVNALAYG